MQTTAPSHFYSSLDFSSRLPAPRLLDPADFFREGGESSIITLSKYESNMLINGFLVNFLKSIAKWSMYRHVADNGLMNNDVC